MAVSPHWCYTGAVPVPHWYTPNPALRSAIQIRRKIRGRRQDSVRTNECHNIHPYTVVVVDRVSIRSRRAVCYRSPNAIASLPAGAHNARNAPLARTRAALLRVARRYAARGCASLAAARPAAERGHATASPYATQRRPPASLAWPPTNSRCETRARDRMATERGGGADAGVLKLAFPVAERSPLTKLFTATARPVRRHTAPLTSPPAPVPGMATGPDRHTALSKSCASLPVSSRRPAKEGYNTRPNILCLRDPRAWRLPTLHLHNSA